MSKNTSQPHLISFPTSTKKFLSSNPPQNFSLKNTSEAQNLLSSLKIVEESSNFYHQQQLQQKNELKNLLSDFYSKKDISNNSNNFMERIQKLNKKFYLCSEKYLQSKSNLEKMNDELYLNLFRQIDCYVDEIQRLNKKITENDNKDYKKTIKNLDKEIFESKEKIKNLEMKIKEKNANEEKLMKEIESYKRSIIFYKNKVKIYLGNNINKTNLYRHYNNNLNLNINNSKMGNSRGNSGNQNNISVANSTLIKIGRASSSKRHAANFLSPENNRRTVYSSAKKMVSDFKFKSNNNHINIKNIRNNINNNNRVVTFSNRLPLRNRILDDNFTLNSNEIENESIKVNLNINDEKLLKERESLIIDTPNEPLNINEEIEKKMSSKIPDNFNPNNYSPSRSPKYKNSNSTLNDAIFRENTEPNREFILEDNFIDELKVNSNNESERSNNAYNNVEKIITINKNENLYKSPIETGDKKNSIFDNEKKNEPKEKTDQKSKTNKKEAGTRKKFFLPHPPKNKNNNDLCKSNNNVSNNIHNNINNKIKVVKNEDNNNSFSNANNNKNKKFSKAKSSSIQEGGKEKINFSGSKSNKKKDYNQNTSSIFGKFNTNTKSSNNINLRKNSQKKQIIPKDDSKTKINKTLDEKNINDIPSKKKSVKIYSDDNPIINNNPIDKCIKERNNFTTEINKNLTMSDKDLMAIQTIPKQTIIINVNRRISKEKAKSKDNNRDINVDNKKIKKEKEDNNKNKKEEKELIKVLKEIDEDYSSNIDTLKAQEDQIKIILGLIDKN